MITKVILSLIFLLGLAYLILPGPSSINDIPPIPESLKSDEPGDTVQNPNIAAYFSNERRKSVTNFYRKQFSYLNFFGFRIPAIRLNHPPEEAFTYVRDQQHSTFLEQYLYPLRDSLFVNGFEPIDENGKQYRKGGTSIFIEGNYYVSKTTLRYYGSSIFWRIAVYLFIWVGFYLLFKIGRKAVLEKV